MNYKPQTLTALLIVTGLAATTSAFGPVRLTSAATFADESAGTANAAESQQSETATPTPVAPDAASQPAGVQGQEVLDEVRTKLESVDTLKCSIQETAILSGMKFHAVGQYVQASGNRVRLEFNVFPTVSAKANEGTPKLEADIASPAAKDATGSLLQVSNGTNLHSQWKNGPTIRVTYRSLDAILKAAGETQNYDASRAIQDLGVGGLKGLIARLQSTMDFPVVERKTVGGADLYILTGRWNPKIRKEIFRLPDDAQIIPEDFAPEYARVFIDAQTLLPRRIQYLKRAPDPTVKQVRPIVTLDFRQIVLNEPVADDVFIYQAPENVTLEDITKQTIDTMQSLSRSPATDNGAASPEKNAPAEKPEQPKP